MKAVVLTVTVLVVITTTIVTTAFPEQDLITSLPGLVRKPNFKQYSGYLRGLGTKRLHYWFVESSSNPKSDPVVLWLNGGPGCSSLHGFLTEHGPFRIQADGKTLEYNPFSWNSVANMIYLESPAGVGFSYSDSQDYHTDDDDVAKNNHLALKDFFSKFPEFKSNDFYISGESYGGIYVPTLSSAVLNDSSINLKGFVVGNGLSSNPNNENSMIYFFYYHGLIGETTWKSVLAACCPHESPDARCNFTDMSAKSTGCMTQLQNVQEIIYGSGLNIYNLYGECAGGMNSFSLHYDKAMGEIVTTNFGWPFSFLSSVQNQRKMLMSMKLFKVRMSPPCVNETAAKIYLNTPAVRTAIHIPEDVTAWDVCSSAVSLGYTRLYSTMMPQYKKAMEKKLRILVYNGDVDMACNFLGDEWFVDSLHAETPQPRKPWYYNAADNTKQVAGFVKNFDKLTFVTIRGAGHMVPTDKPRPALKMFVNYIQNVPF